MKKWKSILVSCVIMSTLCVGCGKSSEPITQTADLFAENNITEDQNINVGRCEDTFVEALTAAIKNENMTIDMNFTSSYDSNKLMNDISLKLNYGKENEASLKIITNDDGEESTEYGYYHNDNYYSNVAGEKTKVQESFDQFLAENDGYTMDIDSSIVSNFACVEENGTKTYYMQYDPVGYEKQLITSFEASGDRLGEDESVVINYANLVFEIDENNIMKGYQFTTSTKHTENDKTVDYIYDVKVDFKDINNTKVDIPTDLDAYVESSQQATETAPEVSEMTTNIK